MLIARPIKSQLDCQMSKAGNFFVVIAMAKLLLPCDNSHHFLKTLQKKFHHFTNKASLTLSNASIACIFKEFF